MTGIKIPLQGIRPGSCSSFTERSDQAILGPNFDILIWSLCSWKETRALQEIVIVVVEVVVVVGVVVVVVVVITIIIQMMTRKCYFHSHRRQRKVPAAGGERGQIWATPHSPRSPAGCGPVPAQAAGPPPPPVTPGDAFKEAPGEPAVL